MGTNRRIPDDGIRSASARRARPSGPRPLARLALIGWTFLVVGCANDATTGSETPGEPPAEDAAPLFEEISTAVGLEFTHQSGMSGALHFPEIMGAGVGLFDYDGDRDLDLYLVQGGSLSGPRESDRLFRNDLDVNAEGADRIRLVDVTEESGLLADGYGMAVAVGDYDNDGHPDLYLANFGVNQFWRNKGDGSFEDVTERTGTDDDRWSTSASFVDFDLDGWLDLVVINYVDYDPENPVDCSSISGAPDYCGPQQFPATTDRVFRNLGDGRFEDVSESLGFLAYRGAGLGVIASDFNEDGWPDLYVSNDLSENHLWINREGKAFVNEGATSGTALNRDGQAEASMGLASEDFDGDGDLDIFITHLANETNTLYRNEGEGRFLDASDSSGLAAPSVPATGFGVAAADLDLDGWIDLLVANGDVKRISAQVESGAELPFRQQNQWFRNLGNGRFEDESERIGPEFLKARVGRGIAHGDVDNDGAVDFLIGNNSESPGLFRNRSGDGDAKRQWIGLELVDAAAGGRIALGAMAKLVLDDGTVLTRRAHRDGSYASSSDARLLFNVRNGMGAQNIEVIWPGGDREWFLVSEMNRYLRLERGAGSSGETP